MKTRFIVGLKRDLLYDALSCKSTSSEMKRNDAKQSNRTKTVTPSFFICLLTREGPQVLRANRADILTVGST